MTFADWNPDWDNGDDEANGTEESKDTDSDIGGTEETKQDEASTVDNTAAAAPVVNTHVADNAASNGSGSPPLLSNPPLPKPLVVEAPPPSGHILPDSSTAINYAAQAPWTPMPSIGDLPTADDDPMATLHWAISTHLAKLECQRIAVGAKYDAFHDLLVKAQTDFDVSAIERRVRSAVGVHSAPLVELVSNAKAVIDTKYDDISALHRASKSALTEAIALCDGPTLNRRALAVVDNAMMAAVAPGGLMDQHISEAVTSADLATVDNTVAQEIQHRVQDTLNNIIVSYQDCVIAERHVAEKDLAESFQAQQASATTDFQDFVTDTISASIDALDTALRSDKTKFECKRDSVVEAITTARRNSNPPTPVPRMPSRTSLKTMVENATPVGTTKVAWADSQSWRQPTPTTDVAPMPSPPASANPSAAADATRDHIQHGGAHPGHLDPSQRGGALPDGPYPPYFASGSCARNDNDSAHYGGAARADHNQPYRHSGPHDEYPGPSPTGFNSHSPKPLSDDACSESSRLYHCGQFGLDIDVPLGEDYLHSVGFTDATVYSGIIRLHRIIRHSWHNSHYNSYGPQKESILKSTAFSTRLLLKKIDAPSVVNWYEHLTSTCKAFLIGLIPFDAIQFTRPQEGLCIPGLGFERYDDMASALCTAMPICLAQADSRVQAMIAGVETKTRNGYEIVWNLLYRYVPGFDPTKTVDKPSWDEQGGDMIQRRPSTSIFGSAPSAAAATPSSTGRFCF
jgi:hypothetical protein